MFACNESAYCSCVSFYSILLGQALCEKFHFYSFAVPFVSFPRPRGIVLRRMELHAPFDSQIELCSLRLMRFAFLLFLALFSFVRRKVCTTCSICVGRCSSPRHAAIFLSSLRLHRCSLENRPATCAGGSSWCLWEALLFSALDFLVTYLVTSVELAGVRFGLTDSPFAIIYLLRHLEYDEYLVLACAATVRRVPIWACA